MSTTYNRTHFSWLSMNAHGLSLIIWWMLHTHCNNMIVIMALVIYNAHIIHFHMDHSPSVTLGQRYFAHNDYLVVYCWTWVTILHLIIITLVGGTKCLEVCLYFKGVVGYMLNGVPCYCNISHLTKDSNGWCLYVHLLVHHKCLYNVLHLHMCMLINIVQVPSNGFIQIAYWLMTILYWPC